MIIAIPKGTSEKKIKEILKQIGKKKIVPKEDLLNDYGISKYFIAVQNLQVKQKTEKKEN